MAIPFNLPSDSEHQDPSSTDERLDQLLLDLYNLLRQILLRPHCDHHTTDGAAAPSVSRQVGADVTRPAVVLAASSPAAACSCLCPCVSRRRPPRRHRPCRRRYCCPPTIVRRKEEQWLVIGEQLRKIAEEFKSTVRRKEIAEEQPVVPSLRREEKTSGLFSLLLPGQFRSSLWTTVFLLVGWRLLTRSR